MKSHNSRDRYPGKERVGIVGVIDERLATRRHSALRF
jgi:hypothetical protein